MITSQSEVKFLQTAVYFVIVLKMEFMFIPWYLRSGSSNCRPSLPKL